MNENKLLAGAGTAEVLLDGSCLLVDGFTAVHDPLHVRALVLEDGKRTVIVSVEITSIFPPTQRRFEETIQSVAGAVRENIWLCLTHSFSGPHIWPRDGKGPPRSEEELARCERIEDAYAAALETALKTALDSMRPAVIGHARGESSVAVSRNVETDEGWWLGTNPDGPCDRSLPVVRIDGEDGMPIALLFNYGVRSEVMSPLKLVSSDLCGNASVRIEKTLGVPAIFLCGACGDQEPGKKGSIEALNEQSETLAADVLELYEGITQKQAVSVQSGSVTITCPTKWMNRDLKSLRPTRSAEFAPDGEKKTTAYVLRLGSFTLVGVQPEIDGITSKEIAFGVPGDNVAVCVMVNGGDKCMPERRAYELVKYQCLNSPYMPGAAEALRDAAIGLVNQLKEGNQ